MRSSKAKSPKQNNPIVISKSELEKTLYEQLVAEIQAASEARVRRAGEFTRKEFIEDINAGKFKISETHADRLLARKIDSGEIIKRNGGGNRVYFRFVEVKK